MADTCTSLVMSKTWIFYPMEPIKSPINIVCKEFITRTPQFIWYGRQILLLIMITGVMQMF